MAPRKNAVPEWVRRHAVIAADIMLIGGALSAGFSAILYMTGGTFPPWPTHAQMRAFVNEGRNADACKDYNERFIRAQRALSRNPDDMTAIDLYTAVSGSIAKIPDCKPAVLPRNTD